MATIPTRARWTRPAGFVGVALAIALLGVAVFAALRVVAPDPATTIARGDLPSFGGAPAELQTVPADPREYVIIYTRHDSPLTATAYHRVVDASSRTSDREDLKLGPFLEVELARATAPWLNTSPVLRVQDITGHGYLLGLTADAGPIQLDEFHEGVLKKTTSSAGDILFRQVGKEIVGLDPTGRQVAAYAVPQPLPPEPGEPTLDDGSSPEVLIKADKAKLTAVVPAPEGRFLPFVQGVTSIVVADLDTGKRLDLVGKNVVMAATLAADGFVYAAVWNGWSKTTELEIVKIDPESLEVVARHDTGNTVNDHVLLGRTFLALPGGDLFLYFPRLNKATGEAESLLYRIDPETAAAGIVPLPLALGNSARVGVDGKIYLSGGFAQNRVSVYDPATGELQEDVPWLRAPEGTYVNAVVVR